MPALPLAAALVCASPAPAGDAPEWARGAVWYQVFPERFRNGNPENDPKGPAVFLAPWNADWYAVQPGELEAAQQRRGIDPAAFKPHHAGPLYNVIWDRRYGGDLQGLEQKLDELADLGVTAIYLNPIFHAMTLHKYDAADFRHIDAWLGAPPGSPVPEADGTYEPIAGETDDPATWTWTPADRYFVDVLLPACKRRGLRVVLDGVWNHTGRQFWAFQDVVRNGQESRYAPWFQCQFDGLGRLTGWTGWPGRKNGELPEFRQVKGGNGPDSQTTVERGDLNAGVGEHIFNVTRRWMDPDGDGDPADGIDGWRLDVAGEVGSEFWRDWRSLVKEINPESICIAEIWGDAGEMIREGAFDTQMNYPFAYPVLEWLSNADEKGKPVTSDQLADRLAHVFAGEHNANLIKQNLLASHDTDRLVNMFENPGRGYDRDRAVQDGADKPRPRDPSYVPYKPGKPGERAYALARLALAIQATYLGSPMVYYGDEYGMWGADDPTCRKPLPWPDAGAPQNADDMPVAGNRDFYRAWLRLRQDPEIGACLRLGTVRHLDSGSDDVFAFLREHEGAKALVVINRGDSPFDAAPMLNAPELRSHTSHDVPALGACIFASDGRTLPD